jgi:ATP-dependent Clp protease ATP-binding subunit ClpC
MFERFTDRARRVTVLSQEECRLLDHRDIGTEHVLLGMLSEGESIAYRVLTSLGVHHDPIRDAVWTRRPGEGAPSGHIQFTAATKRLFELSLREALQLGHNYIAPEHILLALCRLGEGTAVDVLVAQGLHLSEIRRCVINTLTEALPRPPAAPKPATRAYLAVTVQCPDCGSVVSDMAAHNDWHEAIG